MIEANETDSQYFLQDLNNLAFAPRYQRWQFDLIRPYLKGKVLEIGGGIGSFTELIADHADSVISLEPNSYCYEVLLKKAINNRKVKLYRAQIEQYTGEPGTFDCVVLMNVLEHIEDDLLTCQKALQMLKPGGKLIFLVPAMPWAFGKLDTLLGHYRRYTVASTYSLLNTAGFNPQFVKYYNPIGALAWWWNAKICKKTKQSPYQIKLFDRVIFPACKWMDHLELPFGQSLLAVAIK